MCVLRLLNCEMEFSRHTELLEGIVNQLIDEEGLGVCLEMHRAIKLGYYELLYPEDRSAASVGLANIYPSNMPHLPQCV